MTRLALALLLLAACATPRVGGYEIVRVPSGEPIMLGGTEVRARVDCTRKRIVVHEGDEYAELHELEHVLRWELDGVACPDRGECVTVR